MYTEYEGQEIMFHVSTLLPFDSTDRQQVHTTAVVIIRKREKIKLFLTLLYLHVYNYIVV